jgi:hypothetical protein
MLTSHSPLPKRGVAGYLLSISATNYYSIMQLLFLEVVTVRDEGGMT